MKLFVLLFSLYVLFLSGVPCSADDDCCVDEISSTQHSPGKDSSPDHKPVSPCSPFFACGSCHGIVIPDITFEQPLVVTVEGEQQSIYKDNPLPLFFAAIWQPPKYYPANI